MLALPLLVTTLALAPTGTSSRLELSVDAEFDASTASLTPSSFGSSDDGRALGGQAGAGLTVFGTRVTDDDAPPALQPFLQYAAQLHVDGGGGGYQFTRDPSSQLAGNDVTRGHAHVSASGYADRRIYGYVGLAMFYRQDQPSGFSSLSLPIDVAGGARFGDLRVSVGWSVAPTQLRDGIFKVPFWGGAYARLYAVVQRRLALAAGIDVLEGGVGVDGAITMFFQRRFALGLFVRGGHGHPSQYDFTDDHAGGGVSFEAWTGPRLAVALTYSFDWWKYGYGNGVTENDYDSVIALTFRLRPR